MALPPAQLKAFAKAGKKKPADLEDDEDTEGGDDADHEDDKPKGKGKPPGKKPPGGDDDEGGSDKEVDVDKIGARVQNGKGDKKLMRLSKNVDEENNPPEWVADEDIWEKAKDAVEPKWDEYDQPYAVVAHVYEAMGGEID